MLTKAIRNAAEPVHFSMQPLLIASRACCLWIFLAALAMNDPAAADARNDTDEIPLALPGAADFPASLRTRLRSALSARGPAYVPRTRHLEKNGAPRFSNRLLLESSPYLEQHAHNPVNWYPWGEEAFATAKRLGRPLLISIGYSTCHWCHVMEEESFEDIETARYLNAHFIAIKVDREVRPDIDAIYMQAAQALTGSGGWPLNVWVTPGREPFFAGTYFPKVDSRGRPAFMSVLQSISRTYLETPERITASARQLTEVIKKQLEGRALDHTQVPSSDVFERAFEQVLASFDPIHGGIGHRPKFPSSMPLRFLLRYHRRSGDERALSMVRKTLEKMAAGGIHDQIGGGFHRYSTDEEWLVPHFEKMLYDNALLAAIYLEAWQVTGDDEFETIARTTLDYVRREMTAPSGGFYSATDADSPTPSGDSEEGYYFTWTPEEIDSALDASMAGAVKAYYGINEAGNFEGRNILHVTRPLEEVAGELGLSPEELSNTLESARQILYTVRSERSPPHLDDKILVAWNGLMVSAFARAGFALAEPAYVEQAARAADFILTQMRDEGRLRRHFSRGRAAGEAFLDDYAFLIAGLLDLYEADGKPRWLREASSLQSVLDLYYSDPKGGGYFTTANDHEKLIAREKSGIDGAKPSGNSVALLNLLRLAEWTSKASYYDSAILGFSAFHDLLEMHPRGVGEMLLAVDFLLDAPKEIVIVQSKTGRADAMLAPLRRSFVPNRVLSVIREGDVSSESIPLVEGKRALEGRTTAYVCENGVCAYPTSVPEIFFEQISKVDRPLDSE